MNRLSLKNNLLKFETLGGLPILLAKSIEYRIPQMKEAKARRCHEHVITGWI